MPRLVTTFTTQIEVPTWEFCNEQESADRRRGDDVCRFVKGSTGQKHCSLYKSGLYSHYEWIKKCDECLASCSKEETTDDRN